jgi:hypothetical protein
MRRLIIVRNGKKRLQVKSSWDFYGRSRPTHLEKTEEALPFRPSVTGLPDVWRIRPQTMTGKPDFVSLDANKQHYICKINLEMQWGRYVSKDEYYSWFNSNGQGKAAMLSWMEGGFNHYRAYTNFFGMDNMANHLTGERLNMDNPKFAHLITGRAVMKPVLENGGLTKRNLMSGVPFVAFECIRASDDVWQYSPFTHRWLFEQPLSTGRQIGYDKSGAYIVRDDLHIPFPQFGGKMIVPIWLPLDNVAWIPAAQTVYGNYPYEKVWNV